MEQLAKTRTEPDFRLLLPSRAENVTIVRQALAGAIEVLGLEDTRILDINAAVSEACNNVVVHAYGGEPGTMEVYLCLGETSLVVVVSDEGEGIRFHQPGQGTEIQGLGLSLIQTLSDRVEFLGGIDQGTEVRMAFALTGGDESGPQLLSLGGSDDEPAPPPGEIVVAVSAGPLAAPVMGRVIGMLASRAGFTLEGISEAQLVTDSLAAHVPRALASGRIQFGIDTPPGKLVMRVGPLDEGGAAKILEASALGNLPPLLERLTQERSAENVDGVEFLRLTLANPD